MIEARVNQVGMLVRSRRCPAGGQIEGAFRRFGTRKDVGRAPKHSRTRRSDREARVETAREDLRSGVQRGFLVRHQLECSLAGAEALNRSTRESLVRWYVRRY